MHPPKKSREKPPSDEIGDERQRAAKRRVPTSGYDSPAMKTPLLCVRGINAEINKCREKPQKGRPLSNTQNNRISSAIPTSDTHSINSVIYQKLPQPM